MIDWKQMHILVIEENIERRHLLCKVLENLGIEKIIECSDGLQGLVILDSSPTRIHAVICDWEMPRLDAGKLAEALRIRGSTTVIILLTNSQDFAGILYAREYGINSYIQTPFNPEQVQHKLRQIAAR